MILMKSRPLSTRLCDLPRMGQEGHVKHTPGTSAARLSPGKAPVQLLQLGGELGAFSTHFSLKEPLTNYGYLDRDRHFLKNEKSEPVTARKSLLSMIKFELLSKIRILEKLPSPTRSLTASNTSDFSDEINDDINVCFLDIVDIWKICTDQYFPSEQYMLQNHEWAKDPFNKSGGPRDSGATEKRSSLMRFQISHCN